VVNDEDEQADDVLSSLQDLVDDTDVQYLRKEKLLAADQRLRNSAFTRELDSSGDTFGLPAMPALEPQDVNTVELVNKLFSIEDKDMVTTAGAQEADALIDQLIESLNRAPPSADLNVEQRAALARLPSSIEEFFFRRPKSVRNFNLLIKIHAAKREVQQGFDVLKYMRAIGKVPDLTTFTNLIYLCASLHKRGVVTPGEKKQVDMAFGLLKDIQTAGYEPNLHVYGALAHVCAELRDGEKAIELIKIMEDTKTRPNEVVCTSLIIALYKSGQPKKAWDLFRDMRMIGVDPDLITYNTVIRLCAEEHEAEHALTLFDEMQQFGHQPSYYSFCNVIYACTQRPDYYEKAFEYFQTCLTHRFRPNHVLFTIVLHATARVGDIRAAQMIIDQVNAFGLSMTPTLYNCFLNTIAKTMTRETVVDAADCPLSISDRIKMAESIYQGMVDSGAPVSLYTLNIMLKVYARTGDVQKTEEKLRTMFAAHKQKPDFYAFMQLLRMYSRLKRLKDAKEVILRMKGHNIPPTQHTYRIILGTCYHLSNKTEGRKIIDEMRAEGIPVAEFYLRYYDHPIYLEQQRQERAKRTGKNHGFGRQGSAIHRKGLAYGQRLLDKEEYHKQLLLNRLQPPQDHVQRVEEAHTRKPRLARLSGNQTKAIDISPEELHLRKVNKELRAAKEKWQSEKNAGAESAATTTETAAAST